MEQQIEYRVRGMGCATCAGKVERVMRDSYPQATHITVDHVDGGVVVKDASLEDGIATEDLDRVSSGLGDLGYTLTGYRVGESAWTDM